MIIYTFIIGEGDSFVRRTFCSKTVAERERRRYSRILSGASRDARTFWLNEHPLQVRHLKYKHEIVEYMEDITNEQREPINERLGRNYSNENNGSAKHL